MCLYTNSKKPSIAQVDIVCYKFLEISDNGKQLSAPFTQKPVCKRKKIIGYTQKPKQLFCLPEKDSCSEAYCITKGALHAYKTASGMLERTNCYYETTTYRQRSNYVMFKCIIPEGTKYWEGNYGDICSRKLKYVEKVTFTNEEAYEILHEARPEWAPLVIRKHNKSQKKKRKRKAKKR